MDLEAAVGDMKPKYFALIVGNSGSGKTTIVEELQKRYGLKAIESYTTRPPRYDGETGHTFVTINDIPPESEMVAYTYYNGNHYWATQNDVETHDLYIIDVPGINYFKSHYKGQKPYVTVQIFAPEPICKQRMIARGDSEEDANKRIEYDRIAFANIQPDIIFNNNDIEKCINDISTYLLN